VARPPEEFLGKRDSAVFGGGYRFAAIRTVDTTETPLTRHVPDPAAVSWTTTIALGRRDHTYGDQLHPEMIGAVRKALGVAPHLQLAVLRGPRIARDISIEGEVEQTASRVRRPRGGKDAAGDQRPVLLP
jgi:hypothetical protein